MYTSTARRYKSNISEWIALVAGNILEMCSFNMALLLKLNRTTFLSLYTRQPSNSVSLDKYLQGYRYKSEQVYA